MRGNGKYLSWLLTVLLVLGSLSLVPGQNCVPPPANLVAWWPGDGNPNDIVGGRNGTLVNGATFASGLVAQAFSFNGASWVEVPDDPIWTLGSSDFTVDLWVKFNALSGRDPFIGHDEGGGELNKWIFWYDVSGHDKLGGTPALRFHINSPHPSPVPFPHDPVVAPWSPLLGRWYHVAVTRGGITYALYIDGVQVATDTSTFVIPDPNFPLTIGRAEGFLLNGSVDELEIHSRALSAVEISQIFAAGTAGKCKGAVMVSIDIKPGSFPNSINPQSRGTIPVAVLSDLAFGAPTQVDPASLTFGRTGNEQSLGFCSLNGEDVTGDGLLDLVCHFDTGKTGFQPGDTQGVIKGRTLGGILFMGVDTVKIVP